MSTPELRCPSCGTGLAELRRYCPECGTRLGQEIEGQRRKTGKRWLQWVFVGAAGCLGSIMLAACAGLALISVRNLAWGPPPPAITPIALPTATLAGPNRPTEPTAGGEVLLLENFDRPAVSDFVADEDEFSRYAFERGGYTIEVRERDMVVWTLARGRYSDIAVSVDCFTPAGQALAAAGLIFHYQDSQNFYLFQVSSDGYYTLELLLNDEFNTLIDWTQSNAIEPQANRLLVETHGDRIALYVNEELLEETRDGTFVSGEVGIAVSSFKQPMAAIRFDNLLIKQN